MKRKLPLSVVALNVCDLILYSSYGRMHSSFCVNDVTLTGQAWIPLTLLMLLKF